MTNERHEKALEAAVQAFYDGKEFPVGVLDRQFVTSAIAAYLQAMDAVIVPKQPTPEMMKNGSYEVSFLTHKGSEHCYLAMLSAAPNHFTNGE